MAKVKIGYAVLKYAGNDDGAGFPGYLCYLWDGEAVLTQRKERALVLPRCAAAEVSASLHEVKGAKFVVEAVELEDYKFDPTLFENYP